MNAERVSYRCLLPEDRVGERFFRPRRAKERINHVRPPRENNTGIQAVRTSAAVKAKWSTPCHSLDPEWSQKYGVCIGPQRNFAAHTERPQ